MGRLTLFLCLVFSLFTNCLFAQADSVFHTTIQKNISGDFVNFFVDNLGNTFLLTATNQVKKYDDKADSVAVFNDVRRYGNIYSMDVTNPLRILFYYRDFATALILDRFLNIRNTIDLRKAGITQARAVAQSYDNNIWVFDELESKIKKIDELGKVVFESTDFRLLFDDAVNPVKIIDYNKSLYLYDNKLGWYIFDYYGAFQKKLPYPNWQDVQVFDNGLSGVENNAVNSLSLNNFAADVTIVKMGIDLTGIRKLQYAANKIYVLRNNGLNIYAVQ